MGNLERKFDLNKRLTQPRLFTPIDYGNLQLDVSTINQAMDGFYDTFHNLGYKTEEEKQKELEEKKKTALEKSNQI